MVPQQMKDAAYGMGCTRTQVIWKVVLPTGAARHPDRRHAGGRPRRRRVRAAAVHGAVQQLLAVDDAAACEPTASLSILIYNFSGMPFDNQIELAWAASLVLVLIVLVFNILSRLIGQPKVLSIARYRTMNAMSATAPSRRDRSPTRVGDGRHRLQARQDLLRRLPGRARQPCADREGQDHRLHRPVRLRQEHRAAQPEPDERPDRGLPLRRPRAFPRPGRLRARRSIRWSCAATSAWCSSSRTRSR